MKYYIKSVLFLGIGGISMHQLAIAMKKMGVQVYGYDLKESKNTKICELNGIKVVHKFNKEICNVNICVTTSAITDGKFFNHLKKRKIPILDRAEVLGWICSKFKKVIAVAGTHGKSTTASLIYQILRESGKNVSCHIGADVKNARFEIGDEYLVVEACEFNKSFLKLKPHISVVTNIEREHMDSYQTLFNLRSAFLSFLKKADEKFVYLDKSTTYLKKYNSIKFVENINLPINPKISGEYNLKNIAVAVSVCRDLGVDEQTIINAVNKFEGVARRYQLLGEIDQNQIFIDYAHHPTELKAFTQTFLAEHKNAQIIFQPHTYSRTKFFLKEFVSVLSEVENIIIFKEYSARERKEQGMTAKQLYYEIKKKNSKVKYAESVKDVVKLINNNSSIAFVGAGDINLVAEQIIKQ